MEKNKIIKTIFSVITILLFAKVLGLLRDILVAVNLGTNYEADAYSMATNITVILFISYGGSIVNSSIPVLSKYHDNKEKIFEKANKLISNILIISIVLCFLGVAFSEIYTRFIASGFDDKTFLLTSDLVKILFPSIIFTTTIYIYIAMLQIFDKFKLASITSIPYNLLVIGYVVFFLKDYGVYGLAVATVLGWFMQICIQLPYLKIKEKYKFRLDVDFKDEDVKRFNKIIVPMLITAMAYTVNILVDKYLASSLGEGAVASLDYAYKFYFAISTTVVIGITSVIYPNLSKIVKEKDKFIKLIKGSFNVITYAFLFLIICMYFYSEPIVEFIYKRNNITSDDVKVIAAVFSMYSVGILGFAINDFFSKVLFAVEKEKVAMKVSILSVALNVVLNIILVNVYGIYGLALATAIAVSISGLVFILVTNKYVEGLHIFEDKISIIKMIIIFAITFIASIYIKDMILVENLILKTVMYGIIAGLIYILATILVRLKIFKKEGM
ncbi:MAG: murein biosynthesis integral membrane protein MurJ [Clostridia bacterium]|jgi:putative peptidoglycan lipid II flippase|nr:murein biosynthesis integral membrane protein MurJ [Clostridia bacterium]